MKKSTFITRTLAVVLSIVIVLGVMLTAAFAQTDDAYVAKVGSNYYTDLDSAVDAFNRSFGATFTLLADCTKTMNVGEHWITLTSSGTFDLNGHTLTATGGSSVLRVETNNAGVTFRDSSPAGTGRIKGASYSIWHYGNWDVYIESGIYQNVARVANGSLIINGGVFEDNTFSNTTDDEAKTVLNGGTFKRGIWFPGGNYQNVYEILGQGKTYAVNGQIWSRSSVQALGDVYEFGRGKRVTVVNESDAVASVTYYEDINDTSPDVFLFTSLSTALAKAKELSSGNNFVTLLKDSDENITIDTDVSMIFQGRASGVFTVKSGYHIFLDKPLPEGMKLRARLTEYPAIHSFSADVLCVSRGVTDVSLSVDDVVAVDPGVKVLAAGTSRIGLVHEHKWDYVLTEEDGGQKISVYCGYPQSCMYGSEQLFAYAALSGADGTYNGLPHSCIVSTQVNSYDGVRPTADSLAYYDADGNKLDAEPVDAGTYTAKLPFGDKTASVTFTIERAMLKAEDFLFTPPYGLDYDGAQKYAEVTAAAHMRGVGEVTVKYYDADGNAVDAPVNAGTYTVAVDVAQGKNYAAAADLRDSSWTFAVAAIDQAAPEGIDKLDETIAGRNDGKITGVNDAMEYRKDGESAYTAVTGTEIQDLAPGNYFVRVKGSENYIPSPEVPVTVAAGRMLSVTYRADGKTLSTDSVAYGEDAALPAIPSKEGYTGAWDKDGKNITDDTVITVIYTAKTYTITFMDETGVYKVLTCRHGETVEMPEPPVKDGYTVKWDTAVDKAAGNLTVKAVYTENAAEGPDTPAPGTPEPDVSAPVTSAPVTSAPGTSEPEPPQPDDDGGCSWLWIVLAVVVCCVVLIVLIAAKKKRKEAK